MKLLVCNAGSTSLKFGLYDMPGEECIASCRIERVGDKNGGRFSFKLPGAAAAEQTRVIESYSAGIATFFAELVQSGTIASEKEIGAVGFKTVLSRDHYGVHIIDGSVIAGMEEMMTVAPVHNRCYLEAIRAFEKLMPGTPMVGVFETAFHQTMRQEAYIYSTPYEWYEKYGIRRLGYHGASHSYVAAMLTQRLGKSYRAVSCHLGGSCSLCAIENGVSVDTSFGLSLQTGLLQGSRSGDIDPFLIFYLMKNFGLGAEEIERQLCSNGGIAGISGVSGDLRDVEAAAKAGNSRAKLAVDIFIRELTRYIGGYAAVMGGIDAIAFTGGIGENSKTVRGRVMDALSFLGVEPGGEESFERGTVRLTQSGSRVSVWVIPADEEITVARSAYAAICG